MQEDPVRAPDVRDAVKLIAKQRKSHALDTHDWNFGSRQSSLTLNDAYLRLGVAPEVGDDTVEVAFSSNDNRETIFLKEALHVIAKSRGSNRLADFLERVAPSTFIKEDIRTAAEWPVGLANLGATCYLNSMLQAWFSIKPLRELVLDWEQFAKPLDAATIAKHTVGQRKIERWEVEEGQKFLKEWKDLFVDMIETPDREVKPRVELVMATLAPKDPTARQEADAAAVQAVKRRQSSVHSPMLTKADLNPIKVDEPVVEEDAESVSSTKVLPDPVERAGSEDTLVDGVAAEPGPADQPNQTDEISSSTIPGPALKADPTNADAVTEEPATSIEEVETAPERPPPPPPRPQKAEIDKEKLSLYMGQQDVSETIGSGLFRFSCAIKSQDESQQEQQDQVKDLFWGMEVITRESRANAVPNKDLPVPFNVIRVRPAPTLEEALNAEFGVDTVEESDIVMHKEITAIPPVLHIEIIRAQVTHKDETDVVLPLELYMDRYLDTASESFKQASKAASLAAIEKHKMVTRRTTLGPTEDKHGMDGTNLLSTTLSYLEGLGDSNMEWLESLKRQAEMEKMEAAALTSTLIEDLESQERLAKEKVTPHETKDKKYLLHSVFIHRGVNNSGHYWVYIRDFQQNVWRKYNDGYVDLVTDPSLREVLHTTGLLSDSRKNTPYLMTYVEATKVEELVEPLHRQIPAAVSGAEDVQMSGVDGADDSVKVLEGQAPPPPNSHAEHQNVDW